MRKNKFVKFSLVQGTDKWWTCVGTDRFGATCTGCGETPQAAVDDVATCLVQLTDPFVLGQTWELTGYGNRLFAELVFVDETTGLVTFQLQEKK